MDSTRLSVTVAPLSLEDVVLAASASGAEPGARVGGPSPGAVTTFLGLVRRENQGRRVEYLEYEAYEPLAVRTFQQIADEATEHWPGVVLAIHHRTGRLDVGEASVAIAAASPHRAEAFAACRYAIERIKQIAPVWKREYFEGGDVWIEGAHVHPDDGEARQDAYRRACA